MNWIFSIRENKNNKILIRIENMYKVYLGVVILISYVTFTNSKHLSK